MKLTEHDLDAAIRRNRREWDTVQIDELVEPGFTFDNCHWHGCAGACDQGRLPCTCGAETLQWADIPSPWQWRLVAAVATILVVTMAVAAAGWPA